MNNIMNDTEEWISDLKDIIMEITQDSRQKAKLKKKKAQQYK